MKFLQQKQVQAILFFTLKSPDNKINRLKLMKFLWLADRIHLNQYGRMILQDDYCALPHGPVPSRTMDISKESVENVFSVHNYTIEAEDQFNPRFFSKSDLEVFEEVWNRFGSMSDIVLRDYSHLFPEWKRFENEFKNNPRSKSYWIKIDDFFKKPLAEANFKIDPERSKLSQSVYYENNKIQEILQ